MVIQTFKPDTLVERVGVTISHMPRQILDAVTKNLLRFHFYSENNDERGYIVSLDLDCQKTGQVWYFRDKLRKQVVDVNAEVYRSSTGGLDGTPGSLSDVSQISICCSLAGLNEHRAIGSP